MGLFGDIWAPFVEAGLLLLFSLVLGAQFGVRGVLLGPIISMLLVIHVWKPYYLFSRGFSLPFYRYWLILAGHLCINVLSYIISSNCTDALMLYVRISNEWVAWLVNAGSFFVMMSVLSVSLTAVIFKDFREFLLLLGKKIFKKQVLS